MPGLAEIADDYAGMMAAGEMLEAAQKHWANDVICFGPSKSQPNEPVIVIGKVAALARLTIWLESNLMSDVLVDGPFITGHQFAMFIDMEVTRRPAGTREPFSEIATYTVRDGQIIEERFFYG